jgi:hypothetical protein
MIPNDNRLTYLTLVRCLQYSRCVAPREPKLHSMLKTNSQHLSLLFMIDFAKSHLQILNRADINVVLESA